MQEAKSPETEQVKVICHEITQVAELLKLELNKKKSNEPIVEGSQQMRTLFTQIFTCLKRAMRTLQLISQATVPPVPAQQEQGASITDMSTLGKRPRID
jgi:hypothetical protein